MQMYVLSALLWLSGVYGEGEAVVVCSGVVFQGVYYDKDMLFEGLGKVYNLVMHALSGLLFFSHTIWHGSSMTFGIMSCHIEKRTCRHVPGLAGGYAIGYDRRYDDIYFGGLNGLYKYNFRTKSADYFAEKDKSIWSIFIGVHFYYIEYPTQKLYVYTKRGKFELEPNVGNIEMDNLYISKQQKLYFSNMTGLYKVEENLDSPILLEDKFQVRQMAEDMFGEVYFCGPDGIYVQDKPYDSIMKVADINQVWSITFVKLSGLRRETDGLIYSAKNAIYRLLPSNHSKLCLQAIENEDRQKLQFFQALRAR